jgi:hypothetical protein
MGNLLSRGLSEKFPSFYTKPKLRFLQGEYERAAGRCLACPLLLREDHEAQAIATEHSFMSAAILLTPMQKRVTFSF